MEAQPVNRPTTDDIAWVRSLVEGVFVIEDITVGTGKTRAIRARGRFLGDAAAIYPILAARARARGYTLRFRRQGDETSIVLEPGVITARESRSWLLSVLTAYMLFWGLEEYSWSAFRASLPAGLGFTAAMLSILTAHELAHYVVARHFGVPVTLPYFIPFPLSPLGTMGAVIAMKGIPPTKRAMLLIGMAGPVAGLALAIPILLYGLHLSQVAPLPAVGPYSLEGNSLLYLGLKYLVFRQWLPSGGVDVLLHPVAFAGWGGLLVTALNLIPAGQLDGGHVATALLGDKMRYLNWAIIVVLLVLGIWWQGWWLWAVLIFLFSRVRARPLNDVSPLNRAEIIAAILLLILFVLTFVPVPLRIIL